MMQNFKHTPSPSPIVHQGLDNWLFLKGGSNFVAHLYSREDGKLPDPALEAWKKLIETRTRRCREMGIACLHVIIPDKLTIYGDRQGEAFVDPDLSPAMRLAEIMACSPERAAFLDLVAPMREKKEQSDLYWRTDSHWTPKGCFLAYLALCERLGLEPDHNLLTRPRRCYDAIMDLGAHLPTPPWEQVEEYNFSLKAQRLWINSITRFLEDPLYREEIHTGARARFENITAHNNKKVILFGDSYAKPSQSALTGMFAETVGALDFVWRSALSWTLIRKYKPDIVIVEMAERFLLALPNDASSLGLLECRQILKAWRLRYAERGRRGSIS